MAKEIGRHTPSNEVPGEFLDLREVDLFGYLPDLVPGMDQVEILEKRFSV